METLFACPYQITASLSDAILYSVAVAVSFVGSLYCFVPTRIRELHRDDARQIQWRSMATSLVCLGAWISFPIVFCDGSPQRSPTDAIEARFVSFPKFRHELLSTLRVLFHTIVLYTGSILGNLITIYDFLQRKEGKASVQQFFWVSYQAYVDPRASALLRPSTPSQRWIALRNLVVAPLVEEIAFRACIVSALRLAGMSTLRTTLVAPFFFGIAHAHHALVRVWEGQEARSVLIQTALQLAYTSVFGAYVSYAYIRTGQSLSAVVACHALCNALGLPNVRDLLGAVPTPVLHPYRRPLLNAAWVVGVGGFVGGFYLPWMFT
jgi:membrane protease YdiL (CAAX protease family)